MAEWIKEGKLLWEPTEEFKAQTNIVRYMNWLEENRQLQFNSYDELWKWSVTDIEAFWGSLWDFLEIKSASPYTAVLAERNMPGAKWFEGARLNYTEHVFRNMKADEPAIISKSEIRPLQELSWQELYVRVASFAAALKEAGIKQGDRVVGYIPNIAEAAIAFYACASIGAIWSSCSPDFGSRTVIDRFKQIEPKLLIATDGYRYGGKDFNRMETVKTLQEAIPTLEKTIVLPYLHTQPDLKALKDADYWEDFVGPHKDAELIYERVPFDHPLWILYSSGTTGLPKAIVQGHGGIVLEHLKMSALHSDTREGDRFFCYTTTGWMMWNLTVSSLLSGITIILYDGNPGFPTLDTLWQLAEETGMTGFGTSASFLLLCMQHRINPKEKYDLSKLRGINSTASPLPPEGFQWVYDYVKPDIRLTSSSGGTDVCTGFVVGCPLRPIRAGLIQCQALGVNVQSFNEAGMPVTNEVGELVVTEPMPSMPLFFWNDLDGKKYYESYFEMFPGVWRHGDWIKINDDGSCQIYGRSDSTINRGGIRMGTSEIYSAVESVDGVLDSLVVDISDSKGNGFMPLFVALKEGAEFNESLKTAIRQQIREHCSPRHVPNEIYQITGVPRTLTGKKLEVPIKKILMGVPIEKAVSRGSMINPETLDFFIEFAKEAVKE